MKITIISIALLYTFSANAFFYCKTKNQTAAGSPVFSISVYEKTAQRPYTMISLALGDNQNVPRSFSCRDSSLTDNGAKLTNYQCEGSDANLSVYVAKKGKKWLANLYSEVLGIDVEKLVCFKQ